MSDERRMLPLLEGEMNRPCQGNGSHSKSALKLVMFHAAEQSAPADKKLPLHLKEGDCSQAYRRRPVKPQSVDKMFLTRCYLSEK